MSEDIFLNRYLDGDIFVYNVTVGAWKRTFMYPNEKKITAKSAYILNRGATLELLLVVI
jgi:hypothetical protein